MKHKEKFTQNQFVEIHEKGYGEVLRYEEMEVGFPWAPKTQKYIWAPVVLWQRDRKARKIKPKQIHIGEWRLKEANKQEIEKFNS